jgi:Na+/melibiose symporter-like transporter
MPSVTKKERLFYVLLGVFCIWLAGLGGFIYYVLAVLGLENVDPALTLLTGAGAGLITEFFLMALTLSWNYWFRKQAGNPDAS